MMRTLLFDPYLLRELILMVIGTAYSLQANTETSLLNQTVLCGRLVMTVDGLFILPECRNIRIHGI
jgi:hypothetical protein